MIKVILWDVDGTLLDFKKAEYAAIKKCFEIFNMGECTEDRKLSKSGLIDIFDGVFISEEVGCEKPGIEFFEHVWEQIGLYEKEEVMIVGDSLTSDIQGGNNAGIVCCWYNPEGMKNETDLRIDYEIDDLQKILEFVTG